jgi:hypothetical protein
MAESRTPPPRHVPRLGLPSSRQPVPQVVTVAAVEAAQCDLRTLAALPLPACIGCVLAKTGQAVALRVSSAAPEPPTAGAQFAGLELHALWLAAEHDRAWPRDVVAWVFAKGALPLWRLSRAVALGELAESVRPLGWSLGRVCSRVGLRIDEVWL